MRRGRVELKRIEDKNSRQVTFSKRRRGLMKKAHELSVLCDIDLALIIFSSKGKLYEFCSGNSLEKILERYRSYLEAEGKVSRSVHEPECSLQQNNRPEYPSFWTSTELLQVVQKHLEEQNIDQLNVTELVQLEQQLDAALRQTRSRKTQLMKGSIIALHEKEKKLKEDKKLLEEEVAAMGNDDDPDPNIDLNNSTEQGTLRLL